MFKLYYYYSITFNTINISIDELHAKLSMRMQYLKNINKTVLGSLN